MQLYHCHKKSRCNLKELFLLESMRKFILIAHFFIFPWSNIFVIFYLLCLIYQSLSSYICITYCFFVFPMLILCTYCISPRHLCVLSCGAVPRFDPPLVRSVLDSFRYSPPRILDNGFIISIDFMRIYLFHFRTFIICSARSD